MARKELKKAGKRPRASHGVPPNRKERPMKVRPLYDRILVKRVEAKEQVRGGIIIPDTAKEKPMEAKVEAVGEGKFDDNGKRIPLDVKKGDRILIGKYAGTEIKIEDEELLILREDEVLAIVETK
jgi:chaperonin GroES